VDWLTFNRLALKAARRNPALLVWIWVCRCQGCTLVVLHFYFSFHALLSALVGSWFGYFLARIKAWLEPYPTLWLWLLAQSYALTAGMGRPHLTGVRVRVRAQEERDQKLRVRV